MAGTTNMDAPLAPAAVRRDTVPETAVVSYIQWGPIIAGAIAAAALALVLHIFAGGLGLAVSSTAPTWRDASFALILLSGLYLLLAALASYALGGYIAGRLRARLTAANADEIEARDGTHGLLVWGLATLLTAVLAFGAVQAMTRLAAPSSGPAGPGTSVAGENLIAYELDQLFRGSRPGEADMNYSRAEAARILLAASSHSGISAEDRTYLARLVASRTGLSQTDAAGRVTTVEARAKANISRARKAGVLLAFSAGAAALLGAAAAWFAACAGGRHRDGATVPSMTEWTWRGPRAHVVR
jgi:hypothetical protein